MSQGSSSRDDSVLKQGTSLCEQFLSVIWNRIVEIAIISACTGTCCLLTVYLFDFRISRNFYSRPAACLAVLGCARFLTRVISFLGVSFVGVMTSASVDFYKPARHIIVVVSSAIWCFYVSQFIFGSWFVPEWVFRR